MGVIFINGNYRLLDNASHTSQSMRAETYGNLTTHTPAHTSIHQMTTLTCQDIDIELDSE